MDVRRHRTGIGTLQLDMRPRGKKIARWERMFIGNPTRGAYRGKQDSLTNEFASVVSTMLTNVALSQD